MEADDIERYLAELGAELKYRGIKKPVRLLLIGGAYMLLLANSPRSTKDIDIFWLDEDGLQQVYTPLRESVQIIKQKHDLDADWFNYLAQILMYDERSMSMLRPESTFLPSKSPQDETKTSLIVLYCSRKHKFGHASKPNKYWINISYPKDRRKTPNVLRILFTGFLEKRRTY